MRKWQTAISTSNENGERYIRGEPLLKLIEERSFVDVFYFIVRGIFPTVAESKLLNAIFVSCVDHGVEVPSAFVPRVVVSTGNNMVAALAAGVLTIGDNHGGAVEKAMFLLLDMSDVKTIVGRVLGEHKRIPGYGHKIYKEKDPRVAVLFEKAGTLGFSDTFIQKAQAIEAEVTKQSGKHLPLNVDGAIAALLVTIGIEPILGKAFFILGRMPGMIAHIQEEMKSGEPYRRLDSDDVEYTGPAV